MKKNKSKSKRKVVVKNTPPVSQELAVVSEKGMKLTDTIYGMDKPKQMAMMANVLQAHIVKHNLYTTISGKNYAHVEGWQFAGGLIGTIPLLKETIDLSKPGEYKHKAIVNIIRISDDKIVGRGDALCSNKENRKKTFDEYAILSMAQTRAIGKAYRNMVGWVMKLAGYEGTPSEEMVKVGEKMNPPSQFTPQNAPQGSQVAKTGVIIEGKPAMKPGQVPGPGGEPVYLCQDCEVIIPDQVAEFSQRVFKKRLCRDCQRNNKK